MSSNSKNIKSNSFISNKEIWTNDIKQDPKKFTERFSALKETKGLNTNSISSNQKQQKGPLKGKQVQTVKQPKQKNEDYVEDEMDESVAVSIPKINKISSLKTGQSKMNKPINKSIKKQLSTHNPVIKSNGFPSQVLNPQYYPQHQVYQSGNIHPNMVYQTFTEKNVNQIPQKEYNFININIAPPSNGRFTQNIYMNYPPGSNVPITNINTNNVMINNNGYTNNKINFDNIIIGKDKCTTLMLRNIPNKYTLNNIPSSAKTKKD